MYMLIVVSCQCKLARIICCYSRKPRPEKPEEIPQDVIIDVGVVRYSNKDSNPKAVEAKPEQEDVAQKLIPTMSDSELAEVSSSTQSFYDCFTSL